MVNYTLIHLNLLTMQLRSSHFQFINLVREHSVVNMQEINSQTEKLYVDLRG